MSDFKAALLFMVVALLFIAGLVYLAIKYPCEGELQFSHMQTLMIGNTVTVQPIYLCVEE